MERFVIAVTALIFSASAFAATLLGPGQINPVGSTAGQAILSTGPSGQPGWATVSAAALTGITPIVNGGTGANSATAALTSLGAMPVAGGTFTGNVGFTTLSASGLITPSTTVGIKGTTAGDNAQSGSVGEFITNNASGVSLTSGTPANVTSMTLPAGDWDVWGSDQVINTGTSLSSYSLSISTTSATLSTPDVSANYASSSANIGIYNGSVPATRKNITGSTTYFLVQQVSTASGTTTAQGYIYARRRR